MLIVDDSVVIRRLVGEILAADPDLEVVGAAATGRIALAKIPQTRPDVVTLDVEMPEMDGLETLALIRRQHPDTTVIMFSTLTERGAAGPHDQGARRLGRDCDRYLGADAERQRDRAYAAAAGARHAAGHHGADDQDRERDEAPCGERSRPRDCGPAFSELQRPPHRSRHARRRCRFSQLHLAHGGVPLHSNAANESRLPRRRRPRCDADHTRDASSVDPGACPIAPRSRIA